MGLPLVFPRRVFGANDEIRIALVGCGGRSKTHIDAFGSQQGVRIVAVCDPDRQRLQEAVASVEAKFGKARRR